MPVGRIIYDEAIRSAWARMLHLWKPMAVWTILVWLGVSLLLVPFSSAVLGWGIFRGDTLVVGNEELITWFFTPAGIIYGLLAGGLALTGTVLRFAGLFYIITDDMEGGPADLFHTVKRIVPRIPQLFKLCVVTVFTMGILTIPLVLGLSVIYFTFLGEYDINYYLTIQPAEWYYSLTGGFIWISVWLYGALYVAGRSILGLPAYLSGERSIVEAIKRSWKLAGMRTIRLLKLLTFSFFSWILLRISVDAALLFSASHIIEWFASITDSLRFIALLTGGYLVVAFIIGAIIGFIGFSFISTLLTKFYYEDSELYASAVQPPASSEFSVRFISKLTRWLHPSRLIPIVLILFFVSITASSLMLSQITEPGDVVISAHRAGPPPAPENTLAALERAIDAGADYTEIDVQRTADGVVILAHDADLMRVAGDPRRISAANYEDIRDLVQFPDDNSPSDGRRIVTLDEFLQRANGHIGVMIELKYYGFDYGLADSVVDLVTNHNMQDEVIIMSLNLDGIRQVIQEAPEIRTGFVSALAVGDLSRLPVQLLALNQQAVNPQIVRNARQSGMQIFPWTVNSASAMADMIELGVDGLITDDPMLAVRVLNEFNELTTAERLLLRFRALLAEEE